MKARSITERDRTVLLWVARFHQLSASHIALLAFDGRYTPANRSLRRLTALDYLTRIERRIVGGAHGGSGQYVYQLGRWGIQMVYGGGKTDPRRTIDFHALSIADCFTDLRQAEATGQFNIIGFSTEPDCWQQVGRYELKPDLLVEIQRLSDNLRTRRLIEVDLGTEGQRQLRTKLETYVRAYYEAEGEQWPHIQTVTWVAIDEARLLELRWLIKQLPAEHQPLFEVVLAGTVADIFR